MLIFTQNFLMALNVYEILSVLIEEIEGVKNEGKYNVIFMLKNRTTFKEIYEDEIEAKERLLEIYDHCLNISAVRRIG